MPRLDLSAAVGKKASLRSARARIRHPLALRHDHVAVAKPDGLLDFLVLVPRYNDEPVLVTLDLPEGLRRETNLRPARGDGRRGGTAGLFDGA
jgi:hypothetical protein